MRRQILGKIYETDDTPYKSGVIVFSRSVGSYTPTTQYPPDVHVCRTDTSGNLVDCFLWCNEEGDLVSNYTAKINGRDVFTLSVPLGDGSPVQISVLRAGSQPVETYPQSVIDYIDKKFNQIVNSGDEPLYLKIDFSQANLVNGVYTFNQNFSFFPFVSIRNNLGAIVYPPIDYVNGVLTIDLSDFAPIPGNWVLLLGKKFDNENLTEITQADIVNGEFILTHSLDRTPFIQVSNSIGSWFFPDSIREISPTQISIGLESFEPITNMNILIA
jgi:hypothetical protein